MNAKAYCPCAISLIFKPCPNKNINKMGSIGIGFTVNKGINVLVEKSMTQKIFFNGKKIIFPTINTTIKRLTTKSLCVKIISCLPLGFGFGISGASSLACAYAINQLFKLGKKPVELAQIAHYAEIVNKTGFGTVGTQFTGGFLIKNQSGIPVIGYKLPFIGKKIYAVIMDKIETPKLLGSMKILKKINIAAEKALFQIKSSSSLSFEKIIDISYDYVKKSGLVDKDIDRIIHMIRRQKGHATMIIIGKVILSDTKPVNMKSLKVIELSISDDKIHLEK
jgi:pantoate kinase